LDLGFFFEVNPPRCPLLAGSTGVVDIVVAASNEGFAIDVFIGENRASSLRTPQRCFNLSALFLFLCDNRLKFSTISVPVTFSASRRILKLHF